MARPPLPTDLIVATWAGCALNCEQVAGLVARDEFHPCSDFPGHVGTCMDRPVVREIPEPLWRRILREIRAGWLDDIEGAIT